MISDVMKMGGARLAAQAVHCARIVVIGHIFGQHALEESFSSISARLMSAGERRPREASERRHSMRGRPSSCLMLGDVYGWMWGPE